MKIPRPRIPRVRAYPSENEEWQRFERMCIDFSAAMDQIDGKHDGGGLPPILAQELDRLCAKGNSLAQRFKQRLEDANAHVRAADEAGKSPPPPVRLTTIKVR